MSNTELILNMLAEASTKDISNATNPKNLEESKNVAQQGGIVARVARKELESKTGSKSCFTVKCKKRIERDNETCVGLINGINYFSWLYIFYP
jgi:hypothetical protein